MQTFLYRKSGYIIAHIKSKKVDSIIFVSGNLQRSIVANNYSIIYIMAFTGTKYTGKI